jgi:dTDP-glucose 4,6-dehydratase
MVDVHASPDGVLGSRHYLHARNLADAVLFLIRRGQIGMYGRRQPAEARQDMMVRASGIVTVPDRWNVVGEREVNNLEMAQLIADMLEAPLHYQLVDFHPPPGHDLRYALDGTNSPPPGGACRSRSRLAAHLGEMDRRASTMGQPEGGTVKYSSPA